MMELNKLRKADIFSGATIVLLGLFIIIQALQMPMKDSYGGVQNVWYVSPALFPLLIGATLVILGLFLIKIALKTVGIKGFNEVINFLTSSQLVSFLKQENSIRFYAIVFNLLLFVFILVPHIDFFPATILFLLVFFFMFYCGDHTYLFFLFRKLVVGTILLSFFIFTPMSEKISSFLLFPSDWFVILLIATLIFIARKNLTDNPLYRKRFQRSLIIAFVAPLTIGIIFKYFLLVPMPFEGLVVYLMDAVWYADFWS